MIIPIVDRGNWLVRHGDNGWLGWVGLGYHFHFGCVEGKVWLLYK